MTGGLLGAIEAGGTKFVLAVGEGPTRITATHEIPTRDPQQTLAEASAWFAAQGPLRSIGIASFGPVELDRASPKWGHILQTPKAGWSDCNLAGHFAEVFGVPVGFETDVNGAALGEYHHGAGMGASSLTYITIGTGIGGGTVIDGRLVHGAGHPEMGHAFPRRAADDHQYPGNCPFHGDCVEGLASGPAILARWGASLSDLPPDHEAHERVAGYIAQLCHSVFAMMATEVIVLGGGVMNTPHLHDRVARQVRALDAGYLPNQELRRITSPALGSAAGITGAMLLAQSASRT